ncbi:MAG: hypothetical protein M3Y58_11395 [Chloroflexota bacterium]|nr:hypothetical protein [Chloroflexota bacterium]
MREITALRLLTAHLDAQRAFYTETLGLPLVAQAADRFTVRAGATRLTFAASDTDARYHFAFNIPRNTLLQAKTFLAARVPLLSKSDQNQFHSDDWDADMVYFADTDYSSLCARGDTGSRPRQTPPFRPSPSRCAGRGKIPTTCRISRTTST